MHRLKISDFVFVYNLYELSIWTALFEADNYQHTAFGGAVDAV